MAKMTLPKFDDIQRQLDQISQAMRSQITKQVLTAGAQVYAEQLGKGAEMAGHVSSDGRNSAHMKDSVKVVDVKESTGGYWVATIMPDGYDSRGVAQDLKANVLNKKDTWYKKAEKKKATKDAAQAAMQAELNRQISKYKGG